MFLLLLVLAVTGAIVHGVRHHETIMRDLSITPDNFAEFIGDKHEREQTIDQAFPAGASLSIDDPHGDVTILGKSGDDQIHIVAEKEVYSDSDSDADEKADQLSPNLLMAGGRMSVSVPWKAGASVDLTVTLPGVRAGDRECRTWGRACDRVEVAGECDRERWGCGRQ